MILVSLLLFCVYSCFSFLFFLFFFFNDTATTEIYTLSLHDALPIFAVRARACDVLRHAARLRRSRRDGRDDGVRGDHAGEDRKSTRLNSSHANISYAVFCLKKKKKKKNKSVNRNNYEITTSRICQAH